MGHNGRPRRGCRTKGDAKAKKHAVDETLPADNHERVHNKASERQPTTDQERLCVLSDSWPRKWVIAVQHAVHSDAASSPQSDTFALRQEQ